MLLDRDFMIVSYVTPHILTDSLRSRKTGISYKVPHQKEANFLLNAISRRVKS